MTPPVPRCGELQILSAIAEIYRRAPVLYICLRRIDVTCRCSLAAILQYIRCSARSFNSLPRWAQQAKPCSTERLLIAVLKLLMLTGYCNAHPPPSRMLYIRAATASRKTFSWSTDFHTCHMICHLPDIRMWPARPVQVRTSQV